MCACPARLEWRARALAVVSALGDGARLGSRLNGGRWDRTTQWGALAEVSPGRRRTAPSFDHALQNPPNIMLVAAFRPGSYDAMIPSLLFRCIGLFCFARIIPALDVLLSHIALVFMRHGLWQQFVRADFRISLGMGFRLSCMVRSGVIALPSGVALPKRAFRDWRAWSNALSLPAHRLPASA